MSLALDLLEQADHLARRERQRPKQASLRRSASSAYYSLFHLLTSETVAMLGSALLPQAAFRLQRWFDHGEMRKVCGMFSAPRTPRDIDAVLDAQVSSDLRFVAQAFIRLQEARHSADYDLSVAWTRLNAQQLVGLARDSFTAWSRVRRTHEANVFALALLSSKLFEKER